MAVQGCSKSGASMYQADRDGCTAVHTIAQLDNSTSQQLLKALLNPELASSKELQMPSKGQKYTELPAILYAAECNNEPFIDFIICQQECSPAIAADTLLALASKYVSKLSFRSLGKGFSKNIYFLIAAWTLINPLL